jgi:hypothetical protein
VSITVNQQTVHAVSSLVAQHVDGDIQLSPSAQELLDLIAAHAQGVDRALMAAIHELEDEGATNEARQTAKRRLQGFLFKLGDKVEDAVLQGLQRYVEGKFGL